MIISYDINNIIKAVNILADPVKCTLGPKGNYVLIQESYKRPYATKDGVTVANTVEVSDPQLNAVISIVKQAAAKTNDVAGDGTTTSTVLAQAIINEGFKLISAGHAPIDIVKGLDDAARDILEQLAVQAVPVTTTEQLSDIATISANNDAYIGKLISQAFDKVGKDGAIAVQHSKSTETTIELVEGTRVNAGYLNANLVTDTKKKICEFENPMIFFYDKKIQNPADFVDHIARYAHDLSKPLVVIADDCEAVVVRTAIANHVSGRLKCCLVKAPAYGNRRKEILQDLATLTGATLISDELSMSIKDTTLENFGTCEKIIISKEFTTIIKGAGHETDVSKRITQIEFELEDKELSSWEKEKLLERVTQLKGKIATIKVGGHTDAEVIELKARIDDSLHATRAALEEGIVPGSGKALLNCRNQIKGGAGYDLLYKAIQSPFETIVRNAGKDAGMTKASLFYSYKDIASELEKATETIDENIWLGYNALTDEIVSLKDGGIIDPHKVTRVALENAVSVAKILLMTKYTITSEDNIATNPFGNLQDHEQQD